MKNPPESLILKLHTFSNDVYFNLRNPPKWMKYGIFVLWVFGGKISYHCYHIIG